MPRTTAQQLGALGEQLALEHYERLGFRLLDRNWHHSATGEIDLVLCDGDVTVFAEVKTRRRGAFDPMLAITRVQRRRMRSLAAAWIREHPSRPRTTALRIDAVAVVLDDRDQLVALEQYEDVA